MGIFGNILGSVAPALANLIPFKKGGIVRRGRVVKNASGGLTVAIAPKPARRRRVRRK